MSNEPVLAGIRVLDLSMNLSGPYGSMLLADMGADVVKLEPPEGDPTRNLHPKLADISLIFASVNRNKRSVTIDLKTDQGKQIATELARRADVVFNNFRPGVMERLGLSYEVLSEINKRLVYCSLTGYGTTGPRKDSPAYDLAIQALGGSMSLTGYPGQAPARAGIPITDLCGGAYAVIATLAGLTRRGVTGEGSRVETSLFETEISMLMYWAALGINTDSVPGPQGGGNTNIMPYGPVRARDGHLVIAVWGEQFWPQFCRAIRRDELIGDSRFALNHDRVNHRDELQAIIDDEFRRHTVDEWLARLQEYDVPCNPINDVRAAMSDPQTAATDMVFHVPLGETLARFAGNPIKQTPPAPARTLTPPRLGQHTREVLQDWIGTDPVRISRLVAEGVLRAEPDPLQEEAAT